MKPTKLLLAGLVALVLAACQKAPEPYMTLETKTLALEQDGGTAVVYLASNVYYRVNNDCHDSKGNYWARITGTETQGDKTYFTFEVDGNPATEIRTGTVRFIGDGVTPLKLTLSQNRTVPRGIDPGSASVKFSETRSVFNVYGDKSWKAVCGDSDVKITPSSGFGEAEVTVEFPENDALAEREIKVDVTMDDDNTYTYTIMQGKFAGILADWDLNKMVDDIKATFVDDTDQSTFPGTNGKYVNASSGDGKIEYWAAERTGYSKNKYVCLRAVGANGDPYVSGAIPGDCWYVTANYRRGTIPAGTKIHFYFVTKFGTATSGYWMLEYKDGEDWKPAMPVSTKSEAATKGISGADVSYSGVISYNFAGLLLDGSKNGAYVAVEGTFTAENDLDNIVLRFGQAGHLCLDGTKNDGLYIDQTQSGGQTRFSAQRPSKEDGTAVKTYDQHVTIEIAE